MTAGELIDKLSKVDKDTVILVSGYENGYDDIDRVEDVEVFKKMYTTSWEGKYGDYRYDYEKDNLDEFCAVLISRGGDYV